MLSEPCNEGVKVRSSTVFIVLCLVALREDAHVRHPCQSQRVREVIGPAIASAKEHVINCLELLCQLLKEWIVFPRSPTEGGME